MRILIMTDMEGVSGIVAWDQVTGGKPMYEEGRRLYTEEINAAVRGARSAGAEEIVVVDCHGAGGDWTFNSLVPELLDTNCEWGGQASLVALHGDVRDGLRRRGVRRHARPGEHAGRRDVPHDLDDGLAQPAVQ